MSAIALRDSRNFAKSVSLRREECVAESQTLCLRIYYEVKVPVLRAFDVYYEGNYEYFTV